MAYINGVKPKVPYIYTHIIMSEKSFDLKLTKTKQLADVNLEDVKLLVRFVKFASNYLELPETFNIRLVHANPAEPMTLGCYSPSENKISAIIEKRNILDVFRTIAHEMVHQRQQSRGELNGDIPEIGGKIEDEANAVAGQIMKAFTKQILTAEEKARLGLGTF